MKIVLNNYNFSYNYLLFGLFICIQLPKDQAANLTSDDEAVMKKQLEVAANKHRSARNSRSFSPGIRRKGSLSPEKSISKSLNNSASDRKKRGRTAKNTSGKKSFSSFS